MGTQVNASGRIPQFGIRLREMAGPSTRCPAPMAGTKTKKRASLGAFHSKPTGRPGSIFRHKVELLGGEHQHRPALDGGRIEAPLPDRLQRTRGIHTARFFPRHSR